MDDLGDLLIKMGRMEGQLLGIVEGQRGMQGQLDRLLTARDVEAGAHAERKAQDDRVNRIRAHRIALVAAIGGGAIASIMQAISAWWRAHT